MWTLDAISLTIKLELTFVASTALLIWRMGRVYPGRALKDLAIGWSLWAVRFAVGVYGTMLLVAGVPAHTPWRRFLTVAAVAVSLMSSVYLVGGTLQVAGIRQYAAPLWRGAVRMVAPLCLLVLLTTFEGVPTWWRVSLLLFSSTVVYVVTFGVLTWRLLAHPADDLTTGRQLAAFTFALYVVKQLYNAWAYIGAGAPNSSPAVYTETIVHVAVAMGTVALLLERERQRAIEAVQEQRRLEAELAARDHLDSIGRLAGGVAHDFNNMLTGILGNAQLGRMRTADGEACLEELDEIESTATRASALTKQLLTFARRERVRPVCFDLVERVRAVHRYVQRQIGAQVVLTYDLPDEALMVLADPDRVEQALVNLVMNAADALPDGRGAIAVTVSAAPGALRGADAIRLVVQDDGVGMDARVKARLFEPFFTTKGADRGTGLGLSIVHGAVMQANGEIRVDSDPGLGARFELLLPLAAAPTAAPQILSAAPPLDDDRTVCVLVVDDDVLVRRVAVRLLHKAGFQVVEAGDAEEALRVHGSQATSVQLLLTDIMMPGDNGRTLARLLRARDPQLAVVYMSGYEADAFTDEPDAPEGPFVAKPFSEAQIITAVRQALTSVRTAVPIV